MRRALNWKQISVLNLLLLGVLTTACMTTTQQLSPQFTERPTTTAEMATGTQQPVLATIVPTDTVSSSSPTATVEVTTTIQTADGCPATKPISDEPPKDPNADPFGQGPWYVNEDRTIWVGLPTTRGWAAGGEKVLWIRPSGTDLEISGRRLDGEAPPLRADIPCCYPTGFQVTGLIFPTEGCWEVTATAGDSQLRFVTQVAAADHPVAGGTCETLADAVQQSDVIAIGRVTDTETEGDYAWHTVSVVENWKLPPGWSGVGDWFSLLQDLRSEQQLAENGRYLLFLQYAPWQLLCGQRSVVTMAGNRALPLGNEPLWHGGTTTELEAEIEQLLAPASSIASREATATNTQYSDCPVTQPPETPFIPPEPWPSQPPGTDQFWYGDRGLWTALPASGSWRQLALGEKFWWWSEEFDVAEDTTPDLTVTARRLNDDAASFQVSEATNGYHSSFNWAMLIGVTLASAGCWEFTGEYKGHQLSFVLWVPSDIVATLATLPSTPSVEASRLLLEAFFDAYNRHDLAGVLATLAEPFVYGDCDFAARQVYVFETKDELTTWLNAKFADQDQFLVEEMIIAPTEGSPPDDPRNTAVRVLRTNTSLQAIAEPRRSLFKIILNPEGNRIQYLNTYGNVECEAGH